ncbi:hypothetical protein DH2020_016678 [Rehmannia glutinosa]|uniref:Uncharacterized protein n=1 Tax=Rehmannia glutinosa TaxID=99300 RepID=A0ABR0WNP2_REHGL
MRKIPSLRAGAAVAMAEFNIHVSPPLTTSSLASPPPAAANCDARKCPGGRTRCERFQSKHGFNPRRPLLRANLCSGVQRRHSRRHTPALQTAATEGSEGGAAAEQAVEIPALIYTEGTKLAGGGDGIAFSNGWLRVLRAQLAEQIVPTN